MSLTKEAQEAIQNNLKPTVIEGRLVYCDHKFVFDSEGTVRSCTKCTITVTEEEAIDYLFYRLGIIAKTSFHERIFAHD
jgi:hypothetical protein